MMNTLDLTAAGIHDHFLSRRPAQTEIDALRLGLEARAADPESAGSLAAIAEELRQRDALHLLPLGIQRALQPEPIHQTDRVVRGRIHTVTEVRLVGVDADELFEALFDRPWTWWNRGQISGWRRTSDGGRRFVLWPAWLRSPARVGIELGAPERSDTTIGSGSTWTRISCAASFFADFEGPVAMRSSVAMRCRFCDRSGMG